MKTVIKKWGREEWIVNEPEYCAKFLYVDKDASGSLHYHPVKKETFILLQGSVSLIVQYQTTPPTILEKGSPYTINPGVHHKITGLGKKNVILEVSTHHNDEDVVRLNESQSGQEIEAVTQNSS